MLFCCLWRNAETSCHKHFVVVSRHQQTLPLTTSGNCCNLPRSGDTVSITPGCHSIESTRWSQILAQNRDFYLPHLHSTPSLGEFLSEYCHAVWYGKLEWLCYPMVKIFLKICLFILTECTNVTDTHTATPHDDIGRACIASRGKTVANNANSFQNCLSQQLHWTRKFFYHFATPLRASTRYVSDRYIQVSARHVSYAYFYFSIWLAVWLSGNALASINVVALRQTRLVLGWVTVCGRVKCVDG